MFFPHRRQDFMSLNQSLTFDSHINPRPAHEQPGTLYIQVASENSSIPIPHLAEQLALSMPTETQQPENAPLENRPHATQHMQPPPNTQTVLNLDGPGESPSRRLFVLPAAGESAGVDRRKGDRCARCVKALCPKRFVCAGRGCRDSCSCDHPQLKPGEKVRISEKEVKRRLAEMGPT